MGTSGHDFLPEFIEKYRTHKCLLKQSSKFYHDKTKQNAALDDILELFRKNDITAKWETVLKKIQSMRSSYNKELRRAPEMDRLTEIRSLVSQLYTALNAGEHTARLERELQSELECLKEKLEPLEKKKRELDLIAGRKANAMTWVGLGLMSVQFGILARLTWWEYSWDIMEPVTYFVTYGTAMAAYAYFVLTRQEYMLPDVRDRQHLLDIHKRAAKVGLNIDEYNRLKDGVARLEGDLARLRDPISRIPIQPFNRPVSEKASKGLQASSFLRKIKTNFFSLVSLLKKK